MERKRSSGFHRIFTVAFYRLFSVRFCKVNVNDCHAELDSPRRCQKYERYSENTTKPAFNDPQTLKYYNFKDNHLSLAGSFCPESFRNIVIKP